MRKPLIIVLFAALALAAPAGKRFGADAVWHPRPGDEQKTWVDMQQCGAMMAGGSPGSFETCVGEAMRKHGASEAAIAFNNATGGNAYATRYVADEYVDTMEGFDPFQPNSNEKLFFVNGTPSVIDVDAEARKLDANKHPQFQALKKKYGDAFLFPHAEHDSRAYLMRKVGEEQRFLGFTLRFPILNGCYACESVGIATVAYQFDPDRKFQGTTILEVTAGRPAPR